ncbi:ChaN family lipoprotein [Aestuariivita boseongensis]|uniref:ChaN family lipoprotein n=1 Tax=Aestuariivita boseongensis TaxID=1470562 RepID=UPI001FE1C8F2|nr:ChaN family lipoprotein [Aestuariivita boseongensis]
MAAPSGAVSLSEDSLTRMATADVVLLGEVHDNPAHHVTQADLVRRLQPAALVFEMLTDAQASAITPDIRGNAGAVAQAVNWAESGWPDFAMYHPIFLAAPGAAIHGAAVPRDAARAAMQQGLAQAFGDGADRFGLTVPLDDREQAQREALQAEAHCDALPDNLLPGMVDIQRLRDARLAQVALAAFEQTGGPVVIITGNGHARADWGVPHYLRQAAPGITLFALGQSEGARLLPGAFDAVIDAPIVARPDPCEAFRN